MPNIFRSLVFLLFPLSVFGQSIDWLTATNGTGQHHFYSIDKNEAEGAIYAVGSYEGELNQSIADPLVIDVDGDETLLTSIGGEDLLFSKYSLEGELVWSVTGGSSNNDAFLSVAVNENGSVWVGGFVRGDFTLSTPVGDQDIDTNGSRRKALLALFSSEGELLYYELHDNIEHSAVYDLVIKDGYLNILYHTEGYGHNLGNQTFLTNRQWHIQRRDESNIIQWTTSFGRSTNDEWIEYSESHPRIDNAEGVVGILGLFNSDALYISMLDANGYFLYQYDVELSFDGGEKDYFVAALDESGDLNWIHAVLVNDPTLDGMDIKINCDGVYICGTGSGPYFGSILFPNSTYLYAPSESVFLARLGVADGATYWAKAIYSEDSATSEGAFGMELDEEGNIYCAGYYVTPLDLPDFPTDSGWNKKGYVFATSSDGDHLWSTGYTGDNSVVVKAILLYEDKLVIAGSGSAGIATLDAGSEGDENAFLGLMSIPANPATTCCDFFVAGPLSVEALNTCGTLNATFNFPNIAPVDVVLQYSESGSVFNDFMLYGSDEVLNVADIQTGFYRLAASLDYCGSAVSNVVEVTDVAPIEVEDEVHPGAGLCGLETWLNADTLVYGEDGILDLDVSGDIVSWVDFHHGYELVPQNGTSAVGENNRPTKYSDKLNGHPMIEFDGDDNLVFEKTIIGDDDGLHFWAVVRPDTMMLTPRILLNSGGPAGQGYGVDIDRDSVGIWTPSGDYIRARHNHFNRPFLLEASFETVAGSYLIIDGGDTIAFSSEVVPPLLETEIAFSEGLDMDADNGGPFVLGMPSEVYDESQGFIGQIGEVIAYKGIVEFEEASRIRSYLAMQYGLSLNQSEEQDYLASDGSIAVNMAGALNGLEYGVTVIGADQTTRFYQETSRSMDPNEWIELKKVETGMIDGTFSAISHNNEGARPALPYLGQDSVRMERFWGIYENVDFGDIRITLPNNNNNPYQAILLSSDSTFSTVDEVLCMTNVGSDRIVEFNATHETYFTFVTNAFAVESVVEHPSCLNTTDGSIALVVSGTAPFIFEWEEAGLSGEEFNELTDLGAGSYTVQVQDDLGCATSIEIELINPPAVTLTNPNVSQPSCALGSDGEFVMEAGGGTGSLTYTLSLIEGGTPTAVDAGTVPADGQFTLQGLSQGNYTCTVTDSNGCNQSLDLTLVNTDTEAPLVACLISIEREIDAGCTYTVEDFTGSVFITEACGVASVTQVPAPGTTLPVGSHSVQLEVTDTNGNSSSCASTLNVVDATDPEVTCPGSITRTANSSCNYALEDLTSLVLVTDCGVTSVSQNTAEGTLLSPGIYTIEFTVNDSFDNETTCSTTLEVVDEANPVLNCPADVERSLEAGCMYTLEDFTSLVGVTDCLPYSVVQSPAAGEVLGLGAQNITFIVTDDAGNEASCDFNVQVVDTSLPQLVCSGSISKEMNASCNYVLEDLTSMVSATDCSAVSIVQDLAVGTVLTAGSYVIEFTAEDTFGNTSICDASLEVIDSFSPEVVCLSTITRSSSGGCDYALEDLTTLVDVTDCSAYDVVQDMAEGTVLGIGTYEINFTIEDASGNTAFCSSTLEVLSGETVEVICPGSESRPTNASCVYALEDFTNSVTFSGFCGATTVTQFPIEGTELTVGVHSIEIEVEDQTGTTATCSFELEVIDETAPVLGCIEDQVRSLTAFCNYTLENFSSMLTVDENCSIIEFQQLPAAGTNLGEGSHLITVFASDDEGNLSQCEFELTIQDLIDPTITCLSSIQKETDANCVYVLEDFSSDLNASDNCMVVSIIQTPVSGTELTVGTHTIDLLVTDSSGNTQSCEFEIEVLDTTAPAPTCNGNQTRNINASCVYEMEDFTASLSSTENCGIASFTQTPEIGTLLPIGNYTVEIELIDLYGNQGSCSFELEVADMSAPLINCLNEISISLEDDCFYEVPSFEDELSISETCSSFSVTQSIPAGTALEVGMYEVVVDVVDAALNANQCVINIEVEDVEVPSFTCLSDQLIASNNGCNHVLEDYTGLMDISDNCGIQSITQSPSAGTLVTLGTYSIEVQIVDNNGNLSGCSFEVEILDQEAPSVSCPNDMSVELEDDCSYVVGDFTSELLVNDNCSVSSVIQSPSPGTILEAGDHTIDFTVQDASGNSTSCEMNLLLFDDESPVVECPSIITIELEASCVYAIEDFIGECVISDNCNINSVLQLPAPGTLLGLGWHTVNVFATDASGNETSAGFQLFVVDNQAPIVSCINNQTRTLDATCAYVLEDFTSEISIDENCGISSILQFPSPGTTLTAGIHEISIQVEDNSGLTSSCIFSIQVNDVTAAIIDCPEDFALELSACSETLTDLTSLVEVQQECLDFQIEQSLPAGMTLPLGNTEVTFTVTDEVNNMSSCTTTIIVQDTSLPLVDCVDEIDVLPNQDCDYAVTSMSGLIAVEDNCNFTITSDLDGQILSAGSHPVEITIEDLGGNIVVCNSQVVVPILEEPSVLCPDEVQIPLTSSCETFIPNGELLVQAAAACGNDAGLLFSQSLAEGALFEADIPLSITIEDEFGLTATCATNLIRIDVEAPILDCPTSISFEVEEDCSLPALGLNELVNVDDCSLVEITNNFDELMFDGPGLYLVIFEVTDAFGNVSACETEISFTDSNPPLMNCLESQTRELGADCSYEMEDFTSLMDATDNCGAVTLTQTPQVGFVLNGVQELVVTVEAEDASGNVTTCEFELNVVDNLAPLFNCVDDQEIGFTGCSYAIPQFSPGFSDDECGLITITQIPEAGTVLLEGVHTIQTIAEDESGNATTCEFQITLIKEDQIAIECLENQELVGETCQLELPDFLGDITYVDECGEVEISQTPLAGTLVEAGITQVTIEVTDEYGSSSCTFNVNYTVDTNEEIVCNEDLFAEAEAGLCGAVVVYDLPYVTGTCAEVTTLLVEGFEPGEVFPVGATDVVYEFALDGIFFGSCGFTVLVTDEEEPTIICIEELTSCSSTVVFDLPLAADNCGEVAVTQTDLTGLSSGDDFPVGTTVLEFTATDTYGNSASCSMAITVLEAPEITLTENSMFVCEGTTSIDLNDYVLNSNGSVSWNGEIEDVNGVLALADVSPGMYDMNAVSTLDGCETIAVFTLEIGTASTANAGEDFEVCGLQATLNSSGNTGSLLWEAGANGLILSGDQTATPLVEADAYEDVVFTLTCTNSQGCSAQDQVIVSFFEPVAQPQLGDDLVIYDANPIDVDPNFNGIGELNWTVEGNNELSVNEELNGIFELGGFEEGEYTFIVQVSNGPCPSLSDSLVISMNSVVIPTGFSPNADQFNDAFVIRGASQFEKIDLKVFSRSGHVVYESANYQNDWTGNSTSGEELPADTYYVTIQLDNEIYQGYLVLRR